MGSLVAVTCTFCPYTEELALGSGMGGVEFEAMICDSCRRILAIPVGATADHHLVTEEPLRLGACPECCGEELRHVRIDDRLGVTDPEDTAELCPSCRRGTLEMQWCGLWD